MISTAKQANFLLPTDIIEELRKLIPKREQSKVVTEALRKELKRIKLEHVLETSFGAWKENDHPSYISKSLEHRQKRPVKLLV